ncbi:hypothetical protein [Spiroplasma endosymbiont of Notiophilus biguttatus]|uniref:hypothetical protein n=1 Tax=Spiroplasma endosymbiont of Notiophilus biguttatus TaxID=3066285 RepID=UPI003CC7AFA8
MGVETGVLSLLKHKKPIKFICGDNDTINKQQLKILNNQSKIHNFEIITFNKEKDFIDSELAIVTAISKKINFQQIVIVSDGIRWDMLLVSINILTNRTSPHMYLWREQWNWMSSTMLFKLNSNVLHI